MVTNNNSLDHLKIIGVVGTNGKTTTAKIIIHLLESQGISTKYFHSKDLSGKQNNIISEYNKNAFQIAIIEIDLKDLNDDFFNNNFNFHAIVHTCFDFRDFKNYIEYQSSIKKLKKLFSLISNDGIAVINIDDKYHMVLLEKMENRLIFPYGLSSKATLTASSIEMDLTVNFLCCLQRSLTNINDIEIEPMEFTVHSQLAGRHNIYNVLAAVALALIFGVKSNIITDAIKEFKQLKRRMSTIYDQRFMIIDDCSRNSLGYNAAFETIQGFDYENLHIVKSISNDKISGYRRNSSAIMNWLSGLRCKNIFTTTCSDIMNTDVKLKKVNYIIHKVFDQQSIAFRHFDRLEEAIKETLSTAQENDLILLLGETEMDQGEQIIHEYLKEKL